jgi:C4-dicarboxylate-binding protein DctP
MSRVVVALLASFLLFAASPASAQQPIRIRVTNQLPPSSAMSKGLELWKDRVEKATGGKVKVELYPSSQLYKDNEVVPAVQKKSIEAGLVVAGQFSAYDPLFALFDLPGLFQSYPQAIGALDGDLGRELSERMKRLGVHPLYWAQQGFAEIATTKKAVNTPADLKGLKLRVHSKELGRMAQLLGAAPTTIAASEVSTALSQGTVDGITTSISSYDARKWYEGAPFMTNSKFGLIAMVVIINDESYAALPQDVKNAIADASKAAAASSTEAVVREETEILARLAKAGVKVSQFDGKARAEMEAKTKPMYDEFYKSTGDAGRRLVKAVREVKQ